MDKKPKNTVCLHASRIHILYYDVGVKSPQLRCLRIVPCVALPQSFLRSASVGAKHVPLAHSTPVFAYRGIIIPLLCSYRGGSQGLSSTYEQAHVDLDLLTLASYYKICKKSPLLSFGSNQVDFGGISMPASATANSSAMDVGYMENATASFCCISLT